MRLVVDTNVLVSAMLTPGRSAERLPRDHVLVEERGLVLLLDDRIVDEYREVLARPRFRLGAELVDAFIADLELIATFIDDAPVIADSPTPAQDLPFLEVAIAGEADVIVTGNKRHYPETGDIEVLGPAELLARLED
jgi:putative PIN family toxin of toxin-antitoxin system